MAKRGRKARKRTTYYNPRKVALLAVILLAIGLLVKQIGPDRIRSILDSFGPQVDSAEDILGVPEYSGNPYAEIGGNLPDFTEEELTTEPFERYSELDELGRCGAAYANVCRELMPVKEREEIYRIKPTGWRTDVYDFIDLQFLYNRCHLIAFQLTGENDNERNLITGTRYLNLEGMLPFENRVAEYIYQTGNHVLYRVTPIFEGNNLVASGVEMEAESVEDAGRGICFHVYVYNVQPGVEINYRTGESRQAR